MINGGLRKTYTARVSPNGWTGEAPRFDVTVNGDGTESLRLVTTEGAGVERTAFSCYADNKDAMELVVSKLINQLDEVRQAFQIGRLEVNEG